jgi:Uma2 family endonuclease
MATVTPTQHLYRITVDLYDRMVETGVLGEDDALELLGGVLVRKMPKNPRHSTAATRCRRRLEGVLPAGWHVRQEQPVRIPNFDEPEPDAAVVSGGDDAYASRHPGPGEIALIVEVADSSLARDRTEKLLIYARAGIPVYWIINLTRKPGLVEVYTRPTRTRGYQNQVDYKARDQVPVVIDGQDVGRIAVADLLP